MCPNVLTNAVFKTIKVPMVMKNDEMAIKAAIKTMSSNEELEELMPILATQYKRQFLRITEN